MSDVTKTRRGWEQGIASALLCFAATAAVAADTAPLPKLKPVAIEVDVTSLPASEQAALVPLLRAARQVDALYIRQVWPNTITLISKRLPAKTSAVQAELDALNFFKGPWSSSGAAFIGGVPSERPIGDFTPRTQPSTTLISG